MSLKNISFLAGFIGLFFTHCAVYCQNNTSVDAIANEKPVISACKADSDCKPREGLTGRCYKPGLAEAMCVYYEAKKIEGTVITDKDCLFCSTKMPEDALKSMFLGLQFRYIDYRSEEGKKNIALYNIDTLPVFILPGDIAQEKNFAKISNSFQLKDGKVFLNKDSAGIFRFISRKEIPKSLVYFLDFYRLDSTEIFKGVVDFCARKGIGLTVRFIVPVPSGEKIGYPEEEIKAAIAVKKTFPDKFNEYILKRLAVIKTKSCFDTIGELGWDLEKFRKLAKDKQVDDEFKEENKAAEDFFVKEGNVIVVNNNLIFKIFNFKEEDLNRIFNVQSKN